MKSEPSSFSIDRLKAEKKTPWDGVRNYQARNFMRNEMQIEDRVLFYHSNTEIPAVVGLAKICSEAYPDKTQFDSKSKYFDPKSTKERPRWYLVDVCFVRKFAVPVSLYDIKADRELRKMVVAQRGVRLSVQPVSKEHFDRIVERRKSLPSES